MPDRFKILKFGKRKIKAGTEVSLLNDKFNLVSAQREEREGETAERRLNDKSRTRS